MEEIDAEHPDTVRAEMYLMPERIKATIARKKEEEKAINSESRIGRNNPCPCGSGKEV